LGLFRTHLLVWLKQSCRVDRSTELLLTFCFVSLFISLFYFCFVSSFQSSKMAITSNVFDWSAQTNKTTYLLKYKQNRHTNKQNNLHTNILTNIHTNIQTNKISYRIVPVSSKRLKGQNVQWWLPEWVKFIEKLNIKQR